MALPSDDAGAARRAFLAAQVAALEPFGFVVVAVPGPPFDAVRIERPEDGLHTLAVLSREPTESFTDEQVASLTALGFTTGEDSWPGPADVPDAAAAAATAERVLGEVFGADTGAALDVRHGSTKEEHVAERKVEEMRTRIEPVIAGLLGHPAPQDSDGDYLVDLGHSRVFIAPRALPGRPPIVRVFAITNGGVNQGGELGMFLARLNFQLMFGRFSVDADHGAVWFDETLLGDHVTDEELQFTIQMVADTANEWDQRIAQLFGGTTRQVSQPPEEEEPAPKPGQGGYL